MLRLLLQFLNFAGKLVKHVFPFFRKLGQRLKVSCLSRQFRIKLDILLEASPGLKS